jgi:uncharacterized protein
MPRFLILCSIFVLFLEPAFGQQEPFFFAKKDSGKKFLPDSSQYAVYFGDLHLKNQKIPYPLVPKGWTNDFEHILFQTQIDQLDSIIKQFEKTTSIEIAIATLDSSYAPEYNFDHTVTALGRIWGVGKKDKNNGIIIGFSAGSRKIRISNGDAIASRLSDSDTKRIIDEIMIPEFKKGEYFDGLKRGILEIISILQKQ